MIRLVRLMFVFVIVALPGDIIGAEIQQVSCQSGSCGDLGCGVCTMDGCNTVNQCCPGDYCSSCNTCDGYGACGNGRICNPRSTWRDFGMNWTGPCGPIGRAARWGVPGARCLKYCCDTKGSGDSGWAPPARMPVNRTNTGFAAYSNYGGQYTAAPMVYQPTDTTQLGYSYAHVPTWQRNPGMIPPTPNPSMYHARICPSNCGTACGMGCNTGCMQNTMPSGSYCPGGCYNEMPAPVMGGGSCPGCISMNAPQATSVGNVRMANLVRPQPKPVPVAQRVSFSKSGPVARPQVIRQKRQSVSQRQQPERRSQVQPKRTNGQSSAQGWFGLPSLREVKF